MTRSGGRHGHVALIVVLVAVVAGVLVVVALAGGRHGQRAETSRVPVSPSTTSQTSSTAPNSDPPSTWHPPSTAVPTRMAWAFATAIWTYDTRTWALDDWRAAVSDFVDPAGPADSGDVARAMLPLWPQWEDLARQEARGRVVSSQVSHPAVLAALERDPRAPSGWHAYLVVARQEVTAAGGVSVVHRQATVAVVCRPRCFVWSVSPEGPQ